MTEIYTAEADRNGGRQAGRVLATLIGAAALVVGAFLGWVPGRTGDELTDKALVQADFAAQHSLVAAVGGVSILIALVALFGLVDRSGWLTRLTGAASLVLFVMFGVQAYRFYGHDFGTAVGDLRPGAWLVLGAAVVLLIGGFLSGGVVRVPPAASVTEVRMRESGRV